MRTLITTRYGNWHLVKKNSDPLSPYSKEITLILKTKKTGKKIQFRFFFNFDCFFDPLIKNQIYWGTTLMRFVFVISQKNKTIETFASRHCSWPEAWFYDSSIIQYINHIQFKFDVKIFFNFKVMVLRVFIFKNVKIQLSTGMYGIAFKSAYISTHQNLIEQRNS